MDISEKHASGTCRVVVSRRRLLQGASLALATVAVASTQGLRQSAAFATAPQAMTDLDIANYALTLEHLEAEFYKLVVGGGHENTHVVALTDTITKLGGTPVKELDKYNLPALKTEADVIATIATVEDVGASA